MKTVCFYHGGCADGILSAAIVKRKYGKYVECIPSNYGDIPDPVTYQDNLVFITDFSFEPDVMKDIHAKANYLNWIDHHQTAKDKNPEMWEHDKVPGLRQMDKSGCMLTWNYLYPSQDPPILVTRINDRDLWKNEYLSSMAYHEAFDYYIDIPEDVLNLYLLEDHPALVREFEQTGEVLASAKEKRVERAFKMGFERTILNRKVWCVNSTIDTSDIGNYAVKQGYDAGIVFSKTRNHWHYSVRSIDDKTALEIATHYKGGGHPNAAAFKLKKYILY